MIEHNKCLNGYILHIHSQNELISNLIPATGLKKVFLRPVAGITTAWLRSKRVRVLNWPDPNLSPIENIWCTIKLKIRQRRPRSLQLLETYIRQELDQIPTPQLQKLITSMPRHQEEMLHHGKHDPVPNVLRPVAGIKFEMSSFCA